MQKPRVNVDTELEYREAWFSQVHYCNGEITIRMFFPISFAHLPQMSKIMKEGAL